MPNPQPAGPGFDCGVCRSRYADRRLRIPPCPSLWDLSGSDDLTTSYATACIAPAPLGRTILCARCKTQTFEKVVPFRREFTTPGYYSYRSVSRDLYTGY